MNRLFITLLFSGVLLLTGCTPKVGSPAWCDKMQAKDKGEWTMNEAADFAKHCLLR